MINNNSLLNYSDDDQIDKMHAEYAPKSKKSPQTSKAPAKRRVDDDTRLTPVFWNLMTQTFYHRAIFQDRLDHENRVRSSLEVTNTRENKAFEPALDVLSQPVRDLVVHNGDVLGVPYCCVHSSSDTVQGGFHGTRKAWIFPKPGNFAISYSPTTSTILAGPSGAGKTPCSYTFTEPLIKIYNKEASNFYNRERRRLARAQVQKANKENQATEENLEKLDLILDYVKTSGGAAFCKKWNSIQTIQNYLYANALYSAINGRAPDGFCLWVQNAARFFRCRSENKVEKLIDQWSDFDDYMDNNLIPAAPVTRKEDNESSEDFIGGSLLFESQTMTFSCLQIPDLSDNGFYTRPHVCYMSKKDRVFKPVQADILQGCAELWLSHLAFTRNFQGAPFIYGVGVDVDIDAYSRLIADAENEAESDGKIWLTAYLAKQYQRTHQQALNLKLWELSLEYGKDNPPTYPGWDATSVSKFIDFSSAPDWTKIDQKTFEDATIIENCYLKIFDMTTDHLLDATGLKKSTTVSRPAGRERLSEDAQKAYNVGWERGEPCMCGPNGDVWVKRATVKTLYGCGAYRNHCEREDIDAELKEHGLMFYDQGTRLDRGDRIFIAQNITSSQIRAFLDASDVDVADDEANEEEN